MRATARSAALAIVAGCTLTLAHGNPAAFAQSAIPEPSAGSGQISDDMLTLVVGTRFVSQNDGETSARKQFTGARIPLSAFNDTDNCVDQQALEVAKEYFTTLGRMLGKAGYYYYVPEPEIKKIVSICQRLYHTPPKAWVDNKTKIIAFGKVVPTADAPALEKAVR